MTLGITIGDSSGIGPEVLLKAWSRGEIREPVVAYGDIEVLEYYNDLLGYRVPLAAVAWPGAAVAGRLSVLSPGLMGRGNVEPGRLLARSAMAARQYVIDAARDALAGEIEALVTLPLNKQATRLSDPNFVGHTELIAAVCGVEEVTIMLACRELVVTHVSTHCSLRSAIEQVRRQRIATIIRMTCEAVGRLVPTPRVAVAGLNPHAGENGLFGDEEIREIQPAVEWAQAQGLPVEGPIPPDTVFHLAVRRGKYDAVVCMYHDQGHAPLKLLDFEGGVNIALGLPIIRTSVDHGTAFDIAGQGVASTTSLVNALTFAARLARGGRGPAADAAGRRPCG